MAQPNHPSPEEGPTLSPSQADAVGRAATPLSTAGAGDPGRTETFGPANRPAPGPAAPFVVPRYEVLGELGRGGMGVVYKARHLALKRLVALKVIRGAAQATPDEIARFRVEAEAVARLQHPNIVQIHEVGEQAGTPFCVLEFVDGGSLAQKMSGKPFAACEAARLAETLARAMHYAHHEGKILHRDLKPANVLLTAAGEPKITDFGLAKQLDDDSGQTRTGQVMGTPSYMAPEQAAGDLSSIGPRTDVYALGAILYELLTGRPPFRGPNVAATLQQVQGQQPTPPTKLAPRTPRDLETICLKCLRKAPAERYGSALQLAQELERFRGGEPILARPEGVFRKAARGLRRRWPLAAGALTLAAALAVAWLAFTGGRRAWRAAELGQQLEAGVGTAPADWSGARVEEQEQRIAELAALAPDRADAWREQLRQKFRAAVAARIGQPRLEPAERDAVEELLTAYARRWPEEEAGLRTEFRQRLRDWQEVGAVAAPFAGWEATLAADDVAADGSGLASHARPNAAGQSVVLTTVRCVGAEEMEARWDDTWPAAATLGLLLNTEADGRGYAFVLTTGRSFTAPDDEPPPATLANALRLGGQVYAQIRRDGQCLREEVLVPPNGPLTLRARREANQLEFQVGALNPIRFVDAFPTPSGRGKQGLIWPAGPRLAALTCRQQTLPQIAGPLERADDLFAQGRYGEALAAFEQESAAGSALGTEARYKAALCLVETNRSDEAAKRLERVAGEGGEPWPLLAAFRLWLLDLQQGRPDQAEDVVQGLAARVQPEDVPLFLPENTRGALASQFANTKWGVNLLRANDDMVRRAEKTVQGLEVLQAPPEALDTAYHMLIRVRWMVGQTDEAARDADAWLRKCDRLEPPLRRLRSVAYVLTDRLWLSRTVGPAETRRDRARQALQDLDRRLASWGNLPESAWSDEYVRCMLERVRLQIALGDWAGAESDLARCLRRSEDPAARVIYMDYSDAHGIAGFLRQRHNDAAGAIQVWRQGTLPGYAERHPAGSGATTASLALHLFMALKAGTADDAEVARVEDLLLAENTDPTMAQFVKLSGITPTTVRHAFESRRCEDFMRQVAFGEVPFPEAVRGPVRLVALERMREGAFGADLSPEQEALAWGLTDDLFALYAGGGAKRQFIELAMTWMGTTGFLGWASVAPDLKPSLRGPLAYVMGRRLLTLHKPAEAETLFHAALADAPAGSPLQGLAQAELDKLKVK